MDGQGERQQAKGSEMQSGHANTQNPTSPCRFGDLVHPTFGFPERHSRAAAEICKHPNHPTADYVVRITEMVQDGGLIALLGGRGTGKTQAATIAAGQFLSQWRWPSVDSGGWRPRPVRYLTAYELFASIREAMGMSGKELWLLKDIQAVGLLVIDEIQERAESRFEQVTATNLLDARYAKMLPTILIANLPPDEFGEAVGTSVVSRIQETGEIIEFTGPSFRDKQRK